ncbi:MAG: hypothetical protein P4L84_26180 [Isosphaeraceae bacterium]|nr:hypothetical protein [Isosphaeraceae bacterium]
MIAALAVAAGFGAAPAAPSYHSVERAVQEIRNDWKKPGAATPTNAPGWDAFFDALVNELQAYTVAQGETDQLGSLNRLYQMSVALNGVSWTPAARVHAELRSWLRPRVRLAWAERKLVEAVQGLPETTDGSARSNRDRWIQFVNSDLGAALRQYDGARTVAQRQEALKHVYGALRALTSSVNTRPWVPTVVLRQALDDLYNQPNLDVSADVATLRPFLEHDVAITGPVYRKGYVSQVTAGPKTGFGLIPNDDGIAFYNSQLMSSVTPIWDFNNQIASDQRGRRATKLYHFDATTVDTNELVLTAVIRDSGLSLIPDYRHNTDAAIGSEKTEGNGFGRAIAALIGMNQQRITQKVYDGAIGRIRANVVEEAKEEGGEKIGRQQAQLNEKLRQFLPGDRTLAIRNLLITGLMLRSQTERALVGGLLRWNGAEEQVGADAPQPASLLQPDPGVSADLHLTSILTSLIRGYIQSDAVRNVNNLMVVTHKVPEGTPPGKGVDVTQNVDYTTFLKSVQTAKAANDPKELAIRVKRPERAPAFGADANGYLVALVSDFQLEVPAPAAAAKGGLAGPPAQVYRIVSPQAEFVISFKVTSQTEQEPVRLSGRVEGFDPGPQAKVFAVDEDETKAEPLSPFSSTIFFGVIRSRLQGQPIDVPLSNLKLQGFAINGVSSLDPSGWIRVNLTRTSESPAAGVR